MNETRKERLTCSKHCNREYRTGETCGMKLVMQTYGVAQKCKICEKIETKKRRRAAEYERVQRWQREPGRYGASIEKAQYAMAALEKEIYDLEYERQRRFQGIC